MQHGTCSVKRMSAHQRGIFLVSEGQLVGSEHQRREREANPLVSTCSKVFPRCVQNLITNHNISIKERQRQQL